MGKYTFIKINKIHTYVRGKALEDEIDTSLIRTKMFKSFDLKFLEQQVNEFLDDYIYVNHICKAFEYNVDRYWQFSNKSTLHKYIAVVYYMDYPF